MKKQIIIVVSLMLFICIAMAYGQGNQVNKGKQRVALQPLGKFEPQWSEAVKKELESVYNITVEVLPVQELPSEAFYAPRQRYRAEKLASYLASTNEKFDKVIGLTTKDISTTKGQYVDWGIFGLAFLGKRSGVVSTFRLGGKSGHTVSKELFINRLNKVVLHELGHTFGRDHCPSEFCIMEDAAGTIRVVDREREFCSICRQFLGSNLK